MMEERLAVGEREGGRKESAKGGREGGRREGGGGELELESQISNGRAELTFSLVFELEWRG